MVLSVASQRVFLIILLPGPQSFHVLLSFFSVWDSCHIILGRDRSTQGSRESFILAAWIWTLYSNPCDLMKNLRARCAPLLALDCCQWCNVVPLRGTPSTSQLMPVSLVLFSKMGFLSPLCIRLLHCNSAGWPQVLLGKSCAAGGNCGVSPCDFNLPPS